MPESQRLLGNGLTPKQTKFTQAVVRQIKENGKPNLTQAALQTYDTTDNGTARMIGSENLTNPNIKRTIQEALVAVGLTNDVIANELRSLASKQVSKVSADVKLRSLVELLKLTGQYPTQKHANISLSLKANLTNMKYDDVSKELARIDSELKEVMTGKTNPIEVKTVPDVV